MERPDASAAAVARRAVRPGVVVAAANSNVVAAANSVVAAANSNVDAFTARRLFDELYAPWPADFGRCMSRAERQRRGFGGASLSYSEVGFDDISNLFKILYQHGLAPAGGVFLDVGSGVGRCAFAAALFCDFNRCIGFEILQDLQAFARESVLPRWLAVTAPQLEDPKRGTDFIFECGDASKLPWGDASVVFMNSTTFDAKLMAALAEKAEGLSPETPVVTFTRQLPSAKFSAVHSYVITQQWGDCRVFIQKRIAEYDRPATGSEIEDGSGSG
ncbi:S-adenosyl-L-methionine-dependent methyltransferase [Pelagophyceae sp. CCMP2097]|nr:S-adenosyl-L-methionine-dependent methyltransferase [Pelagophyceae sp. CCMP2097]|mmetsp:Transcript_11301/g.39812  ORF Transcript_11301/g.39812 Transcript_11301/m.39812 type:complete len:274 (+) Transcript_11301:111-932(+)